MANTLEYILKLKDDATQQLKQFADGINQTGSKLSTLGTQFNKFGQQAVMGAAAATGGVYALGATLDQLTSGGKILDVQNAFSTLAKNAGTSSQSLMTEFQKVTDGTVANADLMQRSVKASMLGIPIDKMTELMQIARMQAVSMGEDVGYMLDSIVTGVGRASPLILDNLGITLKMGEVFDKAATSLGKTSEQLTDTERKQAVLNAVLEWGTQKQQEMGNATDSNAGATQRLNASLENMKNVVLTDLIVKLTPIIEKFTAWVEKNPELITQIILITGAITVLGSIFAIVGGIANVLIGVFGMLTTTASMLGAVIGFLVSPIGLVILAITAIIAIGVLLITHWDAVKAKAIELFGKVVEVFNNIKTTIVDNITEAWTQVSKEVSSWPGKMFDWGKRLIQSFADGIKSAIGAVTGAISDVLNRARQFLEGHSPPIAGPFKDIDKWGFNVGTAWVDGMKEALSVNPFSGGNGAVYNQNINVTAPIHNNLDAYSLGSILGQQLAFSGRYD